jgi:phage terminase small subunit
MALTDKEISFIDEYLINGCNATEAIRKVSPKIKDNSARTEGWRMLIKADVRAEIDRRLAERRAQNKLTVAHVENLLRDFAEVDLLDIFQEDGDLKPLSEIPPHARRAIASIEVEEIWDGPRGERECIGHLKKIKLVDKRGAAELLGKWKKMFTDKVEVGGTDGGPLRISVSINGIKKGQG